MKPVFLYAGQGSQQVGMGKDFYEKYESYRKFVDGIELDFDHKALMHEGPLEKLSLTEYTQPCMAVFAAGLTLLLKEKGIEPAAACGLSLGEYSALFAAGVFDAKSFVRMTRFRGMAMAKAAQGLSCFMSAILGASKDAVEKACEEYEGSGYVTVANLNCPGQYVICGDEEAVAVTEELLKERGAKRCVRLNVSGPFHTKFMRPAGDSLRGYLEEISFDAPIIPVALNFTGDFAKEDTDLKENLVSQIQNSVHLEEDLRCLLEAGYRDFIEIGPGNAVSGFLKKTAREAGVEVNITTIQSVEDFMKVTGE